MRKVWLVKHGRNFELLRIAMMKKSLILIAVPYASLVMFIKLAIASYSR